MERFAGINSIALNPSFSATFPLRWDLRIAGIDLHAQNNYGFARNSSLPHLLQNIENLKLVTDTSEVISPQEPVIIDFFQSIRPTYGTVNARVDGPAFSLKLKDYVTVGMFSSYRTYGSSYRIAQSLSHEAYENSGYDNSIPVSPFRVGVMAWSEIGLNLAFKTSTRKDKPTHIIGFNPKLLIGHQGAYASTNQRLVITRLNEDSLSFSNGNWEYGITNDFLKRRFEANDMLNWNGMGLGFDIGYSVLISDPFSDIPEDYKFKFGLSLLDVGSINFEGKARDHVLDFNTLTIVNTAQFTSLTQLPDILNQIGETFLQDSLASKRSNTINMGIPTGISTQLDVKMAKNLYVGGYWVQRMPISKTTISRVNTIAVTPRYDSRWLSLSLPFVLHDYKRAQIGFAARLGYLTVGSDQLGGLFMKQNAFSGTNLYMSLKFNPFTIRYERNTIGKDGRKWSGVGCYRMTKKKRRRKK